MAFRPVVLGLRMNGPPSYTAFNQASSTVHMEEKGSGWSHMLMAVRPANAEVQTEVLASVVHSFFSSVLGIMWAAGFFSAPPEDDILVATSTGQSALTIFLWKCRQCNGRMVF